MKRESHGIHPMSISGDRNLPTYIYLRGRNVRSFLITGNRGMIGRLQVLTVEDIAVFCHVSEGSNRSWRSWNSFSDVIGKFLPGSSSLPLVPGLGHWEGTKKSGIKIKIVSALSWRIRMYCLFINREHFACVLCIHRNVQGLKDY